ncbi:hypothetical protein GY532_005000 [Escherichia coli]|nr:hypothetical protein [Escherichia coli]
MNNTIYIFSEVSYYCCANPVAPSSRILYSVFCILYSVFCILYSVFCILYSVFCIVKI